MLIFKADRLALQSMEFGAAQSYYLVLGFWRLNTKKEKYWGQKKILMSKNNSIDINMNKLKVKKEKTISMHRKGIHKRERRFVKFGLLCFRAYQYLLVIMLNRVYTYIIYDF